MIGEALSEREPTDIELGIDHAALLAEAVVCGITSQLPNVVATLRELRTAAWHNGQTFTLPEYGMPRGVASDSSAEARIEKTNEQ